MLYHGRTRVKRTGTCRQLLYVLALLSAVTVLLAGCTAGDTPAASVRAAALPADGALISTAEVERIIKRKVASADCTRDEFTQQGWSGTVRLASCTFGFEDEEGEDSQAVTVHRVGNVYNVPQAMRGASAVCGITAEGQPVDGVGDWARWVYAPPEPPPGVTFSPFVTGTLYARQGDDLICVTLWVSAEQEKAAIAKATAVAQLVLKRP